MCGQFTNRMENEHDFFTNGLLFDFLQWACHRKQNTSTQKNGHYIFDRALLHLMEFSILLKLISNFPWWTTLHFFMLLYIYKNSLEKNPFLLLFIFSNVSASNSFNFLELYINFLFVLLYINFLFILSTNDLFIWSVQVLAIKCCFINEMTIHTKFQCSFFLRLLSRLDLSSFHGPRTLQFDTVRHPNPHKEVHYDQI